MNKEERLNEIEQRYKEWALGLLKCRFDLKPEAFDERLKGLYSYENCVECLWYKIKPLHEWVIEMENKLEE